MKNDLTSCVETLLTWSHYINIEFLGGETQRNTAPPLTQVHGPRRQRRAGAQRSQDAGGPHSLIRLCTDAQFLLRAPGSDQFVMWAVEFISPWVSPQPVMKHSVRSATT